MVKISFVDMRRVPDDHHENDEEPDDADDKFGNEEATHAFAPPDTYESIDRDCLYDLQSKLRFMTDRTCQGRHCNASLSQLLYYSCVMYIMWRIFPALVVCLLTLGGTEMTDLNFTIVDPLYVHYSPHSLHQVCEEQ